MLYLFSGRLELDAVASQGMKGDVLQGPRHLSLHEPCLVLPGLPDYPRYYNSGVSTKPEDFG